MEAGRFELKGGLTACDSFMDSSTRSLIQTYQDPYKHKTHLSVGCCPDISRLRFEFV